MSPAHNLIPESLRSHPILMPSPDLKNMNLTDRIKEEIKQNQVSQKMFREYYHKSNQMGKERGALRIAIPGDLSMMIPEQPTVV